MAGFVYIMTNAAFPHLVKIGKSSKDPRQDRVNELNHTGVPHPFRVEYYAFVEDEGGIERWLHSYFDVHRPNKAREFFQIGVAEAIVAVRDAANLRGGIKYEEVFYVSQDELKARRRKDEEERKKLERFNEIRQAEAAAKRERDGLRAAEERRRELQQQREIDQQKLEAQRIIENEKRLQQRKIAKKQENTRLLFGYLLFFCSLPFLIIGLDSTPFFILFIFMMIAGAFLLQ